MREFDLIAVLDGTHVQAPVPEVQMVVAAGMTAVLSAIPRPLIRLPKSRAGHLKEVAARLGVQEACMLRATTLPVRQDCGMTHDGAAAFLATNQPFLNDLLARFAGLHQVQVTVGWNAQAALQQFAHEPELEPIFARGSASAQQLADAMQRLASRLCGIMEGLMAKASVDTTALPVAEDVLWNGALLVSKSGLTALDAAVEEVDAIWPEGLQIRQIGPAPVSSFALLDVEPVSAAQITAALCLLGLRSLGDHRDLAAARRSRLIAAPGSDSQAREAIRNAAHIIDAATRAPNPGKGFTLCRMMAQGRAIASDVVTREVA